MNGIMGKSKDKYLFVTAAPYHFLISLLIIKSFGLEKDSLILAHNVTKEVAVIANCIKNHGLSVITTIRGDRLEYLISAIKDRKRLKDIAEKWNNRFILVNFRWNVEHVFIDAKYAYEYCSKAIFIEDGPACYMNYTGNGLYRTIKKVLGAQFDFHKDPKLINIFVTDPDKYPESFKPKIKVLDLDHKWGGLDQRGKDFILDCFISHEWRKRLFDIGNVGIIYTQPLSEDGYITEDEKKNIFKEICTYYKSYGNIVLKIHPRDLTNYSFLECPILPKEWPSELMRFLGIRFQFAVGICTSAVLTTNAEIKLNLNENFLKDKKFILKPLIQ